MSGDLTSPDRARLRWRARRGLLENDLMITRFLDACEAQLTEAEVQALTKLFEMDDTDLLDVLLGRAELPASFDEPQIRQLVERMKSL
ncbi:MAG TPA: succinate dehydrogenase assembly factor 2 [Castellaniella sp.]|uniref:succinate dehydrogenase assembly factor 2 n=1 Tax=Castellaniella sp. TaxID=1955812 RepID=UPI002F23B8B1